VNARKNEIETEQHLQKVAEREEGRLKQEITRLGKENEELKEKRNIYEVHIKHCWMCNTIFNTKYVFIGVLLMLQKSYS
jgi:hypothetical protein